MSAATKTKSKKQAGKDTGIKFWKFVYNENSGSPERLDRIAVIDNESRYTFRQFFRRWETYAEVFTGLNITEQNHSRIGILMSPSIASLSAVYGANMVGVSVSSITETEAFNLERFTELLRKEEITDLIIDNTYIQPDALKEIMRRKQECGLRNVILVHKNYNVTKFCQPLIHQVMEMNYHQLKRIPGVLDFHALKVQYEATPIQKSETLDEAAYIVHTSGTTKGIHKPIPLSDRAVNESAVRILNDPSFENLKGGIVLVSGFLSGAFFFLDQMNLALAAGCTIACIPLGYMNPNSHKAIKAYNVSVVVTSPNLFDNCLIPRRNDKDIDFSSVDYIVLGGSFVSGQKRKEINEFIAEKNGHAKVAVGYGLSEVGSAAILAAPGTEDDSIGYPMLGVKILILDENDNQFYDIADGPRSGGLYICSTSNSTGRIGDTQFFETETINGEEYICTYDRVTVNEDGSLTCHGRMNKYFINNEGIKFDAGLVEVSMSQEADIDACAVVPYFDKDLHDTVPALYLKTRKTGEAAREAVRKALYHAFVENSTAEKTNVPNRCVICRDLPLNQAGKIDIYQIINGGVSGDTYAVVAVRQDGVLRDIKVMPEQIAAKNPGTMPQELEEEYRKYTLPMFRLLDRLGGNKNAQQPKLPDPAKLLPKMGCNPRNTDEAEAPQRPYDALRKPLSKPLMGCNPFRSISCEEEVDDEADAPAPRYHSTAFPFRLPLMGCNPYFRDEDDEDE